MSYVLDGETTDQYQYLSCPGSSQITVQVSNAQVLVGFGQVAPGQYYRAGAGTYPPADEPLLPTQAGLTRNCDEIRVKSKIAGTPARVTITAR